MRTVWKYSLRITDGQQGVMMPAGAKVLPFVHMQGRFPTFWADIPDSEVLVGDLEKRYFVVHGTGHRVGANEVYIGTYMDGPFVWHVFEVIDKK